MFVGMFLHILQGLQQLASGQKGLATASIAKYEVFIALIVHYTPALLVYQKGVAREIDHDVLKA